MVSPTQETVVWQAAFEKNVPIVLKFQDEPNPKALYVYKEIKKYVYVYTIYSV